MTRTHVTKRVLLGLAVSLAISVSVLATRMHSASPLGRGRSHRGIAATAVATTLPKDSGLQIDGGSVTMTPTNQSPTISASDAYAAYRKWIGSSTPFSAAPTYVFGLFSDANVKDPNPDGVLEQRWQDVPAWAVVFRGVSVMPVGKGDSSPVIDDVTYFVSDQSGAVLEELTSPVTVTSP